MVIKVVVVLISVVKVEVIMDFKVNVLELNVDVYVVNRLDIVYKVNNSDFVLFVVCNVVIFNLMDFMLINVKIVRIDYFNLKKLERNDIIVIRKLI